LSAAPDNPRPFIPVWLDEAGMPPAEFRLYCHLCRRTDKETGIAWPKVESMAEKCGTSDRTVKRLLTSLVTRGLIANLGKPFAGSCRYRILANSDTTAPIDAPPIVTPRPRLIANEDTTAPIDAPPIVPFDAPNSDTTTPPIVTPRPQEGTLKKVLQRRESKVQTDEESEPLPFESAAFRDAWQEWEQHRREIKKPLTPANRRGTLKKLAAMGEPQAIATIEHVVANGWQGLFQGTYQTRPAAATGQPATAPPANPRILIVGGRSISITSPQS
jgi:hypothetical protein